MDNEIKATRLADLVSYQEQSVVSKTLMEKKTGTVTLFAFDDGQGLSEHTAPFDAMVCVLDGEVGRRWTPLLGQPERKISSKSACRK